MDERLKQRLIYAAFGFCWTVIPFQLVFNSGFFGFQFTILKMIIGIVIAAAIGAGAFFVGGMSPK